MNQDFDVPPLLRNPLPTLDGIVPAVKVPVLIDTDDNIDDDDNPENWDEDSSCDDEEDDDQNPRNWEMNDD